MKIGNLELDRHRKLTLQFFPQFATTFTHYYPTSPPTPTPSAPHCWVKKEGEMFSWVSYNGYFLSVSLKQRPFNKNELIYRSLR